ncbi:MAG: hypothetical protein SGARI_004626 [Bacillariaceae sp.]
MEPHVTAAKDPLLRVCLRQPCALIKHKAHSLFFSRCVRFLVRPQTPGCTVQAQGFDDRIQEIRKNYGAEVVGISGQDVKSKQKFASELGLSFSILADEGDEVRKAFAVPKAAFGLFPGRVTYVLDKAGVCQMVHNDLADAASHVDKAADALSEMKPANTNPLASLFG